MGEPKNQGTDPVGRFGTHRRQFWIFEVRMNNQIKTYSAKVAHASFQAS